MKIVDGRKIQEEILSEIRKEVEALDFQPVFCDVLVGNDPASIQYVRMKRKMAESVGIRFHNANFKGEITTEELIEEIKKLNKVENMCGIIVQLPLPGHIEKQKVLDAIDSKLDVDCLGTTASDQFYSGSTAGKGGFPTALACMALLDSLNIDNNPSTSFDNTQDKSLKTRKIAVLGQGMLVGKPVSALLKFRGISPDIVTSKTPDKEEIIKNADVIISGMGRGKYITGQMIKKGAVIIDAGTSEASGSIVGDVDLESVKEVASYVSPVPGGVGPVTVAMLLRNVLSVAKQKELDSR